MLQGQKYHINALSTGAPNLNPFHSTTSRFRDTCYSDTNAIKDPQDDLGHYKVKCNLDILILTPSHKFQFVSLLGL